MTNSTNHRVALVTGADRGIGLETARQLAQKGITVLVTARDPKKAEAAATELSKEGSDAHPLTLDVTQTDSIRSAVQQVEQRFGRLDILINDAGVMLEHEWGISTVITVSDETIRQTFETNFFGLVNVTRAFLPLLRKGPQGRIVNISSIMASLTLHADPHSVLYHSKPFAYDASKTAVNVFTIHLAYELRDTPIKVNSAHPGWVMTEIGSVGATMTVEEGARSGVELALLDEDGPSGGFFYQGEPLPW
ncbi:SDR family oxidoreductase [Gloeobacter kilaueensis]|uniref:Short-chain dehydrogenase/reductase SDR n=1 Tax=Gloeobacter kilaueensis (strain ATCC BAA-2537 / CCAP 1431/1 / ULC 316 / JS1) TaxID=1183438 RepID=U5QP32_GLOK1|nr:SDR family oxidoreductase [Gloeobacter kilaueensis]AGY59405.1 short-chain dehydrogenase/reductase SDR [Gloeobacter kilaueensis JS1]